MLVYPKFREGQHWTIEITETSYTPKSDLFNRIVRFVQNYVDNLPDNAPRLKNNIVCE